MGRGWKGNEKRVGDGGRRVEKRVMGKVRRGKVIEEWGGKDNTIGGEMKKWEEEMGGVKRGTEKGGGRVGGLANALNAGANFP